MSSQARLSIIQRKLAMLSMACILSTAILAAVVHFTAVELQSLGVVTSVRGAAQVSDSKPNRDLSKDG